MKSKILPIVGIIILGVVSSAVWELLRPYLFGGWDLAIGVISLGLQTLRDAIYADAARVGAVTARAHSLAAVLAGTIAFFSSVTIALLARRAALARLVNSMLLLTAVFFIALSQRSNYAGKAAAHFDNLLVTTAPVLSDMQYKQYRSRFAQVRTEQDYDNLAKDLMDIVRQNGLRAPTR
jgi:hypothetical protein